MDSSSQVERNNIEASCPNLEDDGLLCSMISSLRLIEAVRTSVISRRWRDIWIHRPNLYFNAANILDTHTVQLIVAQNDTLTNQEKFELLEVKREQFIRSVDLVLQQHQGLARVDEFLVRYFIPKKYSHHLDAWVRFAVTSRTKKLALHLYKPYFKVTETDPYHFPCQLLGSSCIEKLSLSCCALKPPCKFDGLGHLKELCLFYVNITDEGINHLLHNCHNLESLAVWNSPQLLTLSIDNLSQFQSLEVINCNHLREIKVNAVNFNRLCYWGVPVPIIVRQGSQLIDAKIKLITEQEQDNLNFYLDKLKRELPRLQSLTILISGVSKVCDLPKVSNSFTHLTCLEWVWRVGVRMSLPFLRTLLDASPFLEKLKLHLSARVVEQPPPRLSELKEMVPKHPHAHLRKVDILDFYFDQWQTEIALYLLDNATQLKSMTIEKGRDPSTEINATNIQNFTQQVPANVKLAVL